MVKNKIIAFVCLMVVGLGLMIFPVLAANNTEEVEQVTLEDEEVPLSAIPLVDVSRNTVPPTIIMGAGAVLVVLSIVGLHFTLESSAQKKAYAEHDAKYGSSN